MFDVCVDYFKQPFKGYDSDFAIPFGFQGFNMTG